MAKKARRVVKSKAKKPRSKGKGRSKMEVAGESHRHLLAYDQMLRDPCNANLVAPPYRGTDSGYLIRTTDNIALLLPALASLLGTCTRVISFLSTCPS